MCKKGCFNLFNIVLLKLINFSITFFEIKVRHEWELQSSGINASKQIIRSFTMKTTDNDTTEHKKGSSSI